MERKYITELEHHYLVLAQDGLDETDYVLRMVRSNEIPHLLKTCTAMHNGEMKLRYDISACTSLDSRYRSGQMGALQIRELLYTIRDVSRKLNEYLLDARDLYLESDVIFYGPGSDEILLCFVPHLSDAEPDTAQTLAEYMIRHIDHADSAAAQLAYDFYDRISRKGSILHQVLDELLKDESGKKRPGGRSGSGCSCEGGDGRPRSRYSERSQENRYAEGKQGSRYAQVRQERHYAEDRKAFSESALTDDSFFDGTADPGEPSIREADFDAFSPGKRSRTEREKRKKRAFKTTYLPAALGGAAAAAAVVILKPDLTQIGGIGFLTAAVVWIIHNALVKSQSELHNVWSDDDDEPDDDEFYSELMKEMYAGGGNEPVYEAAQGTGYGGMDFGRSEPVYSAPDAAGRGGSDYDRYERRVWEGTGRRKVTDADDDADQTRSLNSLRGYGTAAREDEAPMLVSLNPGRYPDIDIRSTHVLIGKNRTKCDRVVEDPAVSRMHARIEKRSDGIYVTDLFSTNGSFLDGHRLEPNRACRLEDGAELRFAGCAYRVRLPNSFAA